LIDIVFPTLPGLQLIPPFCRFAEEKMVWHPRAFFDRALMFNTSIFKIDVFHPSFFFFHQHYVTLALDF